MIIFHRDFFLVCLGETNLAQPQIQQQFFDFCILYIEKFSFASHTIETCNATSLSENAV